MQHVNRRRLFKLAGVGTIVATGVAIPAARLLRKDAQNQYQFRATLGLPELPLPSYATYVMEGAIDLVKGTGLLTGRVLAGHPDAQSNIGLPGLGRIIAVTGVDERDSVITLRGIVEDRSQLQPGESSEVDVVIDRARGVVQAPFGRERVTLKLG